MEIGIEDFNQVIRVYISNFGSKHLVYRLLNPNYALEIRTMNNFLYFFLFQQLMKTLFYCIALEIGKNRFFVTRYDKKVYKD